jgi:hypothetical protein
MKFMAYVQQSLYHGHLVWYGDYIGILNHTTRFYPMGFMINLIFLGVYSPKSLFFIMKFFGPYLWILTLLNLYCCVKKLTNSTVAISISLLCWIGTEMPLHYAVATVPLGASIFIAVTTITLFFDKYHNPFQLGLLMGGALLIHPFAGGIFIFGGYLTYLGVSLAKKDFQTLQTAKVFFSAAVASAPYFLLFKMGENIGNILQYIPVLFSGQIRIDQIPIIYLVLQKSVTFVWDFSYGINLLLNIGPHWIFGVSGLGIIASFRKFWKEIAIVGGFLLCSLLYLFNPILIDGQPLATTFNFRLTEGERMLFMVTLCISIFAGPGFEQIWMKIREKTISIKGIDLKWVDEAPKIMLLLLVLSQINQTYYATHYIYYGSYWPAGVPDEYTEAILWLNYHYEEDIHALISEENVTRPGWQHYINQALAYRVNITIDDRYFNFTNSESVNQPLWRQFDYIVVHTRYRANFEQLNVDQPYIAVFTTEYGSYTIFQRHDA